MRGADPEKKGKRNSKPKSSPGCEMCGPGPFPTALGLKAPTPVKGGGQQG